MMDCGQVAKKLFEYLDKELSHNDIEDMEKHLAECRACLGHVEFERGLREHLKERTSHQCSEKLKNRIIGLIQNF